MLWKRSVRGTAAMLCWAAFAVMATRPTVPVVDQDGRVR